MKKNLIKVIFSGFMILAPLFMMGCITSAKSDSIRTELKDNAIADLKSAVVEVKKLAIKDLTNETVEKTTMIDNQYKQVLDTLKAKGVDSTDNVFTATDKYMKERERIRLELLEKARFYTNICEKINNGQLSINALERMNQATEEAKRSIFVDLVTKDAPLIIGSLSGKIDPDLLNVISQYLGSVVQVEPSNTPTPIPDVKPVPAGQKKPSAPTQSKLQYRR